MNIPKKLPQQSLCQHHQPKPLSIMVLLCLGLSLSACDATDSTNAATSAATKEQTAADTPSDIASDTSSDLASVQQGDSVDNGIIQSNEDNNANPHNNPANATDIATTNTTQASKPTIIDWSKVASGVEPVDPKSYPYTFSKTSSPVKSYADYFGVDATTAQHNLTIGMAANEPLSKLLDQLGSAYQTHQLTDGEKMTLVVYTTDAIAPSSYDYVIADKIGRGLILPIRIENKVATVETVE